ncbi:universal stress protein [Streptomyces sp. 8L]|uniref:universal stress protein n=1 Tax=Streptomyces sp. 8L TaxID=2877242 RepID=UPI001CD3DB67|nr:universal stress protein [Streptomyces sp. 8L]MCA1221222.1 universal stress protein [Streptomyces sp. 8L]
MTQLSHRREVLVGLDPARSNLLPLIWAVEEARRKGLDVRLLLAVPPRHDTQHVDTEPQHRHRTAQGTAVIENAVGYVRALDREVRVDAELVDGFPAPELCRRSASARCTVLGSRGLGHVAGAMSPGSVVLPVCAHAESPVAVVLAPEHVTQEPRFVAVGLTDGSSRSALAEAYEQASFAAASLEAFWLTQASDAYASNDPTRRPTGRLTGHSKGHEGPAAPRRLLSEALAGEGERFPDVHVEREIMSATPVEDLLHACDHALSVVVCRKGDKGPSGVRLGGAVRTLLREARCPVIVVPPREE